MMESYMTLCFDIVVIYSYIIIYKTAFRPKCAQWHLVRLKARGTGNTVGCKHKLWAKPIQLTNSEFNVSVNVLTNNPTMQCFTFYRHKLLLLLYPALHLPVWGWLSWMMNELLRAFVFSRLDYCNALVTGLPNKYVLIGCN